MAYTGVDNQFFNEFISGPSRSVDVNLNNVGEKKGIMEGVGCGDIYIKAIILVGKTAVI